MGKKSKRKRSRDPPPPSVNPSPAAAATTAAKTTLEKKHKHKHESSFNTKPSALKAHDDDDGDDAQPPANPLKQKLDAFLGSLTQTERDCFFSDLHVSPERRAELWTEQAEVGEELVNQYSWAVPNEICLRILKHFGPIVEIGCGANAYWCRQMKDAGINVVGYDVLPDQGGRISKKEVQEAKLSTDFVVRQGGPEKLSKHSDHTLFLCYPDENDQGDESDDDSESDNDRLKPLAQACLENYQGDYVIHVGELYGDTLSVAQAPWGRSSSPMFQQQLSAEFHCILQVKIPNGWLHVRDTISVWKRSQLCTLVFAADDDDEEEKDDQDDASMEEEVHYRNIPISERIPLTFAAPGWAHLIEQKSNLSQHDNKKITEMADSQAIAPTDKHDSGNDNSEKMKRKSESKPKRKAKKNNNQPASKNQNDDAYECPW